ncbi:MAG TPA: competence protein, partial [Candidatus Sericytochromatia bacterium]
LQIREQTWLVLPELTPEEQKQVAISEGLPRRPQVLWWSGGKLTLDLLKAMEPGVAIASSSTVDPEALSNLQKANIKLYWTGRDGAIQWTPGDEFEPTLEVTDSNTSFF